MRLEQQSKLAFDFSAILSKEHQYMPSAHLTNRTFLLLNIFWAVRQPRPTAPPAPLDICAIIRRHRRSLVRWDTTVPEERPCVRRARLATGAPKHLPARLPRVRNALQGRTAILHGHSLSVLQGHTVGVYVFGVNIGISRILRPRLSSGICAFIHSPRRPQGSVSL